MAKAKHQIKLARGERIIAVVPEYCSGPGWSNAPLWVHIGTNDGRLRTECIQPGDQTPEQRLLFSIVEGMHRALLGTITCATARGGEG